MNQKRIIELVVIFLTAWAVGLLIQKLFLNLDYEVLRSFIVAVGVTVWRFLTIKKII